MPSGPTIAEMFNTYRLPKAGCFADKGEGDRLVEEGVDGECGDDGGGE